MTGKDKTSLGAGCDTAMVALIERPYHPPTPEELRANIIANCLGLTGSPRPSYFISGKLVGYNEGNGSEEASHPDRAQSQ